MVDWIIVQLIFIFSQLHRMTQLLCSLLLNLAMWLALANERLADVLQTSAWNVLVWQGSPLCVYHIPFFFFFLIIFLIGTYSEASPLVQRVLRTQIIPRSSEAQPAKPTTTWRHMWSIYLHTPQTLLLILIQQRSVLTPIFSD